MIEYVEDMNIFDSDATILVCPVNLVGVMGAGLARQFRNRYEQLEEHYKRALKERKLTSSHPFLIYYEDHTVCLFPTKRHWKDTSDLVMVVSNLYMLDRMAEGQSISIPKVGCGLGRLDWDMVRPYIDAVGKKSESLWRVHE